MEEQYKWKISFKLGRLNRYIERDIESTKEQIKFWEEQISEFGEETRFSEDGLTYKEVLELSKSNLDSFLKNIEENNRIIEQLTEECYV